VGSQRIDLVESCSKICRQYQVDDTVLLIIKWGDGSGTGTGGTNQVISSTYHHIGPLELNMVIWTSAVLSERQTSNWKELWTVLETLQFEAKQKLKRVRGRRVYFSDNSVN
jgi:hypothetical protein